MRKPCSHKPSPIRTQSVSDSKCLFSQALRLSKTALGETASGKIVNLLSNDVSRFDIVSIFIHHMWIAPTSALVVMYFLYAEAGYAGALGMVPVFLVLPLQCKHPIQQFDNC